MGRTFAEKLLAGKAGLAHVSAGQIIQVRPDRVMSVSASNEIPIRCFKEIGVDRVWDPDRIVMILDHETPCHNPDHALSHARVREFVEEQKIRHFFDVGEGISHQLMVEKGLARPGDLVFGKDSHTVTYGAVSAFATPIDATEMGCLWATGETWLKVPESIQVRLENRLPKGVGAKDLILHLIGKLSADGATYMSVEFSGLGAATLGIEDRMTICNMCIEMGAKNGVFVADDTTIAWDRKFDGRGEYILPDEDADYAEKISIDLKRLKPQIACPHRVDNVKEVSRLTGTPINQVFIGSCTNGRLSDLAEAASLLKGQTVHKRVRLLVAPASRQVFLDAAKAGIIADLLEAGATILPPGCGPCYGYNGILADGERCLSTSNRNFKGRMGNSASEVYLASPVSAAVGAIYGEIRDPSPYCDYTNEKGEE